MAHCGSYRNRAEMRSHPASNRFRVWTGRGASRSGRALIARTMPATTATTHSTMTASTISVTTSIAAPPSERNVCRRADYPRWLRSDLPPALRLFALFGPCVFLDHRTVVKQRLPHTLSAALAFLADRHAARAPHLVGQRVLRQRVLALTKQGKQKRVRFSDRIAGRIHEAALDLVPLGHIALACLGWERL